ncbi:GntR family transcriptional regulator [Verrucosispora sp. SN26_14.1]|uniref:GntR family transcriptional regulator n=1 Tax=Verrucosispora sp. SN26_14.1 TaxID=2527879 RepID=UPI0010337B9B|nr:GntR family transcriptional regulator [Verrucosispora sp. SN26_14.1]TBL41480.1 GntR family transcriptional regulator [Verrucosispora sp. SN26_14.1]
MPTPHYGQPRYRVIADELRKRIESGAIPPGALLPAESVLTSEFGAARGTIRKAIAALREEGYAVTEHGRGTHATRLTQSSADEPAASQREMQADARLATLFQVEVGTTLIEREAVIRRGRQVARVIRTYHLRRTDPDPAER